MRTRLARMTLGERRELTAAANEAARGREVSTYSLKKAAITRQRRQLHISKYEFMLARWLRKHGFKIVHQKLLAL